MEFRILGPLEVAEGGRLLELGRPKQRAVLAILLVHANRTVSLEHLVDELWGDEPPAQAIASLQAYVSHLRRLLEPEWPEGHDRVWGGWSAIRGRHTPGTAIFAADLA